MKSNYIVRARKFMKDFLPYLLKYNDNVEFAVLDYNRAKHRHVEYYHGLVRRCVCLADYAVKWDYSEYHASVYGGCESEVINYNFAREHGYEYLLAEITPIEIDGHVFYVMPRVKQLAIRFDEYEPDSRLSEDEYDFLYEVMGLHDMHDENWGIVSGQVKIIDYANCRREES